MTTGCAAGVDVLPKKGRLCKGWAEEFTTEEAGGCDVFATAETELTVGTDCPTDTPCVAPEPTTGAKTETPSDAGSFDTKPSDTAVDFAGEGIAAA